MVNTKETKQYNQKIATLNSTLWENKVLKPKIDEWLTNFGGNQEQIYALYLLSRMMYFSMSNIRCLLKAVYRDLYRYPIIEEIRKNNHDTLDDAVIEREFKKELEKTLFFGMGDASESGSFLLYHFRQENNLPLHLFKTMDKVLKYDNVKKVVSLNPDYAHYTRFVFIDDVCGSGSQATGDDSFMKRNVTHLKAFLPKANVSYYMLFGLSKGLEAVKNSKLYNDFGAIITMDDTYQCFGDNSRYFGVDVPHSKMEVAKMAMDYGYPLAEYIGKSKKLTPFTDPKLHEYAYSHQLGFGNCQLLLSLEYNTPDNTLPIIWFDEDENMWKPIFKRYNKKY